MTIIEKKTTDLIPYEKNPRKNDNAVESVANSIRDFGFKVPIVIDGKGVVIAGHTRLKAAESLGLETVPCVVADDLTDEQVKAFRLADNKVSELSAWDITLLEEELEEIEGFEGIDMTLYGFPDMEIEEEDAETDEGNERERTVNAYNLNEFDSNRSAGFYQMPVIKTCDYVPEELIGFNYMLSTKRRDAGIHFFIDDYQFERIWNSPMEYIPKLAEFDCCLTPDFSLYIDMPMAMKIWNVYRSRLIGQICQDCGMNVIPTLSWAEPETFTFCFDGLPRGGTVAVSTVGVMRDETAKAIWRVGMDEAIKRLHPKTVIYYGTEMEYDFGKISVKHIEERKGWTS